MENEVLSSNVTPGSAAAEGRDVLVLIGPPCFVGQTLKDAWYSREIRLWTSLLISSSWLKGDSLSHAAVRETRERLWEERTSGCAYGQ